MIWASLDLRGGDGFAPGIAGAEFPSLRRREVSALLKLANSLSGVLIIAGNAKYFGLGLLRFELRPSISFVECRLPPELKLLGLELVNPVQLFLLGLASTCT
jgi:hypothetical protein